jgi:hypothetical protein
VEEFLQSILTWFGNQLGPGGFALFAVAVFFAWRWVTRDKDDRDDREQAAKEADARSEALLRLANALELIGRNQEGMRVTLADLRNVLERINTRLDERARFDGWDRRGG